MYWTAANPSGKGLYLFQMKCSYGIEPSIQQSVRLIHIVESLPERNRFLKLSRCLNALLDLWKSAVQMK